MFRSVADGFQGAEVGHEGAGRADVVRALSACDLQSTTACRASNDIRSSVGS